MALSNISLQTTYTTWVARFNSVLIALNLLTEGQANSLGTLTLTNAGFVNGNTTLNISNGSIVVAAGNLRVRGNVFESNSVTLTSNTDAFSFAGAGGLGSTVYLNVRNLTTSVADVSTTNIASANLANSINDRLVVVFNRANTIYNVANNGIAAYTQANLAITYATSAWDKANVAYNVASTISGSTDLSDTSTSNLATASLTNTVNKIAQTAFGVANASYGVANAAYTQGNTANLLAVTVFGAANAAFAKANAALANASGTLVGDLTVTGNITVRGNSSVTTANGQWSILTDAATITWDFAAGNSLNYEVAIAGNRTLGAPTNATNIGQTGMLRIKQTIGNNTMSYHANYRHDGDTAYAIGNTVNKYNYFTYAVVNTGIVLLTPFAFNVTA